MRLAFLRVSFEREKEPIYPGKPPNQPGNHPRWRALQIAEKSTAARLMMAKQSESHAGHLQYLPRHNLRYSNGGWALRCRLSWSALGRGLGLAVCGQPQGLRSCVPQGGRSGVLWSGEQNTMAEGTREEVWACRRSKVPLLGRVRARGPD